MNRKTLAASVCAVVALLLGGNANAVVIEYTATPLGGSTWEYQYTVTHDGAPAGALEEFSIGFALGTYADLVVTGSPAGWDSLVLQPDPLLPDDGVFDSLAIGGGLGVGMSVGLFAVQFTYLAAGEPGEQPFDVVDPTSFDVLFSGTTRPAAVVAVPATSLLMGLGLWLIGVLARYGAKR